MGTRGKIWLMVLLFACSNNNTFAQTKFLVDNFSTTYYGNITIDDTTEVFSKGTVRIFERGSDVPIIEVTSDELALSLHDGKILANIHELPYGEQSLIVFEDFNFDGKKDFAIEDGQNSCYHGPSFRIYLATISGFVFNEAFTDLSQNYCGLFDVDPNFKTLHTMTKDGCCWHQFSEFIVEDNKPKATHIIEEDATQFPFVIVNEENWNGTKMLKHATRTFDTQQEGVIHVLSFNIEKNSKTVWLYTLNNRLHYILLKDGAEAEFAFPFDSGIEDASFEYNTKKNILTFKNKEATYSVVKSKDKNGIEILTGNKTTFWNAVNVSMKGDLKPLNGAKLENVIIK